MEAGFSLDGILLPRIIQDVLILQEFGFSSPACDGTLNKIKIK